MVDSSLVASTGVRHRNFSVRAYFRPFASRWWVVVISALVVAGFSLLASLLQTPVFQSTAVLYVTSGSDTNTQAAYQGSLASQQRVSSYMELAKSDEVLTQALESSGVDRDLKTLRDSVTAKSSPSTVIFSVSVRDVSPGAAATLVNSLARSLESSVSKLETPSGSRVPLARITMISPGLVPDSPVSPTVVRNTLIGLALGGFLGVLSTAVLAKFDGRVLGGEDVEAVVGIRPLSFVPEDNLVASGDGWDFGSNLVGESYRKLVAGLSVEISDDSVKILMVTSAVEKEGKSTTTLGIARALSETGRSVVIVDADLRRPSIASRLSLSDAVGLSSCVSGECSVADALQFNADHGFHVLASGPSPANPSTFLASPRTSAVFDSLRGSFDYVLVDSPPCLPVADSLVLSEYVDGVVLVVKEGSTRIRALSHTMTQLRAAGSRIVGVLVNFSEDPSLSGTYGYGSYR